MPPARGYRTRLGTAALCLATLVGQAHAEQPRDGGYPLVKQPSGECAATSTWLMLEHYYDDGFSQRRTAALSAVCTGDAPCRPGDGRLADAADLEQWIELLKGDALQPSLRSLARSLRRMRGAGDAEPMFEVAGNFDGAKRSARGIADRRLRLAEIRRLLDDNRPVILHMDRPFPFAGHYLTFIGYRHDNGTAQYAFVDTSHPDDGVRWIGEPALLHEDWYDRAGGWIPAALWNGRYLSFWPRATAPASARS